MMSIRHRLRGYFAQKIGEYILSRLEKQRRAGKNGSYAVVHIWSGEVINASNPLEASEKFRQKFGEHAFGWGRVIRGEPQ